MRSVSFPVQAPGLKDTPAAKAIDARHKAWEERLPKDKADLWDWLTTLTGDEQATLFAHCASFGVNALYEKGDRYGAGVSSHTRRAADRRGRSPGPGRRSRHGAGRLASDRRELSRPGAQAPHPRGGARSAGERAAQLIDHLKKADMAKEAERLLADTGWLPEPLRIAAADDAPVEAAETEDDDEALPEFLAGDDEEAEADAPQSDRGRIARVRGGFGRPAPFPIPPTRRARPARRALSFQEGRMPTFTIETTYRLPVYRQRSYEAQTLNAAGTGATPPIAAGRSASRRSSANRSSAGPIISRCCSACSRSSRTRRTRNRPTVRSGVNASTRRSPKARQFLRTNLIPKRREARHDRVCREDRLLAARLRGRPSAERR